VTWERPRRTRILERSALGRSQSGPAILTQLDTTILVPPGWHVRPDAAGNLILEQEMHR
jgi:N-methylhydantoinase A